jgi:hypothetical protein
MDERVPEILPMDVEELAAQLSDLQRKRRRRKEQTKRSAAKRTQLSSAQRQRIKDKTGGLCHLCGGPVGDVWQADHVLSVSGGGASTEDNYLPAHNLCNNYRWHYTAEELQQILKLGVWARTQIQKLTSIGRLIGEKFVSHEHRRLRRWKSGA